MNNSIEDVEATQVIGKLYDSIAFAFPDEPNAPMVLTWMLCRANLDHRVGNLYLNSSLSKVDVATNKRLPTRMPGWDRLTRQIIPEIVSKRGDPYGAFEFSYTAKIDSTVFANIIEHIYQEAPKLGNFTLSSSS